MTAICHMYNATLHDCLKLHLICKSLCNRATVIFLIVQNNIKEMNRPNAVRFPKPVNVLAYLSRRVA